VFSGIQPTGVPHLGNYLGALRNWTALQADHEAFFCVVDLHALTMPWDPAELRRRTVEVGASLLACGIDPGRSVLFVQSHVPAHAELAWLLSCIGRMGELRRMVQFKERSRGEAEAVSVGLFTYPVLQAADVLLYRADRVPVGEDQRQHIELTRDLAQRFNGSFAPVFVLPEPLIPAGAARVMALDDPSQKMSKSAGRPASWISINDAPEVIERKVRTAVTDSGKEVRAAEDKPAISNLLAILSSIEEVPVERLEQRFSGQGYGSFKQALSDALVGHLTPLRDRLHHLMSDPGEVARILESGAERAAAVAASTLAAVREAVGLAPRHLPG
jgi:tryptophanyl-tRNA synthetase